jgi:ribosomal protein L12E/L44/L45/RPP1/RPP2
MKKLILGLVAAFAFSTLAAPAFAEDKPADEKPAKKEKKSKKKEKKEEKPAETK